jgi:hypothetical protein
MWKGLLAVFNYFKLHCHHCHCIKKSHRGFWEPQCHCKLCVKKGPASLKSQCVDKLGYQLHTKTNRANVYESLINKVKIWTV